MEFPDRVFDVVLDKGACIFVRLGTRAFPWPGLHLKMWWYWWKQPRWTRCCVGRLARRMHTLLLRRFLVYCGMVACTAWCPLPLPRRDSPCCKLQVLFTALLFPPSTEHSSSACTPHVLASHPDFVFLLVILVLPSFLLFTLCDLQMWSGRSSGRHSPRKMPPLAGITCICVPNTVKQPPENTVHGLQ